MLLRFDEYPYHQITASFAGVAGSDPQWNDGHYVCVSDQAGQVCLTSSLRLYHNNDVLDGFVCLRHAGRQHNIRLSRRLRPHMDELVVGPLRLEVIEPMRVLRLVLEDNEFDFALDVTCRGVTVPYEDPAEVTRIDGRLISERMTYEITGKCDGLGAGRRRALPAGLSAPTRSSGITRGGIKRAAGARGCTPPRRWAPSEGCRASGSGCCSTCPITAAFTLSIRAAARHQERVPSCWPTALSR